jgi:hypothetical protein
VLGNLGTPDRQITPPPGQPTFRVRDVRPALQRAQGLPPLATIEEDMAREHGGGLEVRVTMAPQRCQLEIFDGNKRAVAVYENRIAAGADRPLDVFLLQRP